VIEADDKADFCIGVAGYPEKHIEAPSLQSDLKRLKEKVDAGADYVVTQMFFDNEKFFTFVKLCREADINVPIIPGIKPLATYRQLNFLSKTFNIDIPEPLVKEVIKCKDNTQVRQVGVEWAIQQSKELVSADVPAVHYYTMGRPDNIQQIAKAIF